MPICVNLLKLLTVFAKTGKFSNIYKKFRRISTLCGILFLKFPIPSYATIYKSENKTDKIAYNKLENKTTNYNTIIVNQTYKLKTINKKFKILQIQFYVTINLTIPLCQIIIPM